MKKRVVALMLCAMTAFSVVACGNKESDGASVEGTEAESEATNTEAEEEQESVLSSFDYNPSDYVTLCEYKEMPLTITGDYEVSREDAIAYFEEMFAYNGPYFVDDESKTVIGEGDIVRLNYTGYLDGVAFDGGAATDQYIDVSKNASADGTGFIEGFTDGLMGRSVGETVDCDVTFPENYVSSDLAGQDVVFTFEILAIAKEVTLEDVDDAFVQREYDVESLEAMYDDLEEALAVSAANTKVSDIYTAMQDYVLANCTVDVPEDLVEARVDAYENHFVTYYCGGDSTQLDSFLSMYYGVTADEARAQWKEGILADTKLEFIMLAIAEKEGIELVEEEYAAYVTDFVAYQGYQDEAALYEDFGYGDANYGEEYMRNIFVANSVMEFINDNAVVTEKSVSETTEDTEAVEDTEVTE